MAVVGRKLLVQVAERRSHEHVDPAQQMVSRYAIFKVELVEQPRLIRRLPPHHRVCSRCSGQQESLFDPHFNGLLQHNLPTADLRTLMPRREAARENASSILTSEVATPTRR